MSELDDQVANDATESRAEEVSPASSESAPAHESAASPEPSAEPEASASVSPSVSPEVTSSEASPASTEVSTVQGAPASTEVLPEPAESAGGAGKRWWCRTAVLIGSVAVLVLIVAGGFFALGWFTSTRGDDGHRRAAYEQIDGNTQGYGQEYAPDGSQPGWGRQDDGDSQGQSGEYPRMGGGRQGRDHWQGDTVPPSQNDDSTSEDTTTL